MTNDTQITIEWPDSGESKQMSWGAFCVSNIDDPDLIEDVAAQIAADNYAEIGGGAAPVVWVFA